MSVLRFLNFMLAAGLLVVACLAYGGARDARLDILTHLALLMTLVGMACLGFGWLIAKRRPDAQIALAALALIAWLGFTGPELLAKITTHSAPANAPHVRVMEFNVYRENNDLEKAEAAIRNSGADIVLTIETTDTSRRLPRKLADIYPHRVTCYCDMTILSRWPIVDDSRSRDTRPGWQREPAIVWAIVRTPSGDVPVMGTHYQWPTKPEAQNSLQKALLKEMQPFDRSALILMGDFNSTPWSFFLKRQDQLFGLERRTRGLSTWPAHLPNRSRTPLPFPLLPIDHVYAGGDWRTVSVRRGPRAGSDHYPVIVTLSRKSP